MQFPTQTETVNCCVPKKPASESSGFLLFMRGSRELPKGRSKGDAATGFAVGRAPNTVESLGSNPSRATSGLGRVVRQRRSKPPTRVRSPQPAPAKCWTSERLRPWRFCRRAFCRFLSQAIRLADHREDSSRKTHPGRRRLSSFGFFSRCGTSFRLQPLRLPQLSVCGDVPTLVPSLLNRIWSASFARYGGLVNPTFGLVRFNF